MATDDDEPFYVDASLAAVVLEAEGLRLIEFLTRPEAALYVGSLDPDENRWPKFDHRTVGFIAKPIYDAFTTVSVVRCTRDHIWEK